MAINFGKAVLDALNDPLANKTLRATSIKNLIGIDEDNLKITQNLKLKQEDYSLLSYIVLEHNLHQVPRLKNLSLYYQGKNPYINSPESRRIVDNAFDKRVSNPRAKYITDIHTAYTFTNPIKVSSEDDDINEFITKFDKYNKTSSKQVELGAIVSKYGRAFELLVMNDIKTDVLSYNIKSVIMDVKDCFIIYDKTIFKNKLAGVNYVIYENDFKPEEYILNIDIYTEKFTINIKTEVTLDLITGLISSIGAFISGYTEVHGFNDIPLLEFKNNETRQGDFEVAIPLINSYDEILSDVLNSYSDLTNEFLHIDANLGASMDSRTVEKLKDANVVATQPYVTDEGSVIPTKLNYVSRNFNFSSVKSQLSTLDQDITKATMTPDISDSSFGGTQTGQSLRYKMTFLDQSFNIKKAIHTQYLIDKYKITYFNILNTMSDVEKLEKSFIFDDLEIIHSKNIPTTPLEEMLILSDLNLSGKLSLKTALSNLSFIQNVDEEILLLRDEGFLQKEDSETSEDIENVENNVSNINTSNAILENPAVE